MEQTIKCIDFEQAIMNIQLVERDLEDMYQNGMFEKFNDNEKDFFNRMKILLTNTLTDEWIMRL